MSRLRLVTSMLRRCSSAALGLAFTLTLFAPLGANAVDCVIEINHVAALAGGITPGDTAGYPVTIDTHGSYRLTGDLLPATSGVRGIEVLSGPVTIDLNGFAIIGPGICVGINPSCSGTLLTVGIEVIANQSVRIQNGTLTGLLTGINVPNDPSVTNSTLDIDRVVIEGNSGTGVLLSPLQHQSEPARWSQYRAHSYDPCVEYDVPQQCRLRDYIDRFNELDREQHDHRDQRHRAEFVLSIAAFAVARLSRHDLQLELDQHRWRNATRRQRL